MTTTAPRLAHTTTASPMTHHHPALIIAGTVIAAAGINLVLWLIGSAAGAEFEYSGNTTTASATPVFVAAETIVPLALGLTLATILATKWRRIIAIAQGVGVLAASGTAVGPLVTDFDSATSSISLALMHVVVAAAVLFGLRAVARSLN